MGIEQKKPAHFDLNDIRARVTASRERAMSKMRGLSDRPFHQAVVSVRERLAPHEIAFDIEFMAMMNDEVPAEVMATGLGVSVGEITKTILNNLPKEDRVIFVSVMNEVVKNYPNFQGVCEEETFSATMGGNA